jgi:hypothetical protein
MKNSVVARRFQVVAAFTEWERQYREDPEGFQTRAEILTADEATYGENAARTFLDYLEQVTT